MKMFSSCVLLSSLRFSSRSLTNSACRESIHMSWIGLRSHQLSNIRRLSSTHSSEENEFLFGKSTITYSDLGVNNELFEVLSKVGKHRATRIQEKVFPLIRNGSDVLITAETGSGKTLSYLIPLIDRQLSPDFTYINHCEVDAPRKTYPWGIILLPNRELVQQVVSMANEIIVPLEAQLTGSRVKIEVVALPRCGSTWPFRDAKNVSRLVVTTPASLSKFIKGPTLLDPLLFDSIRVVVIDEADMLLDGDYLTHVESILTALKVSKRKKIADGILKVHEHTYQTILCAATLPSKGKLSIESLVNSKFRRVKKVETEFLHKMHPRIEQEFVEVPSLLQLTDNSVTEPMVQAVVAAIASASTSSKTRDYSTMIFANSANAAAELAHMLRLRGVDCLEFHKALPDVEKSDNLDKFRLGDGKILVCTDHACRGLDLPIVRHVIQAQFATNVVQYMHRIGRASRAGRAGRATNIFDRFSADLVRIVRECDQPDRVLQLDSEEVKEDQQSPANEGMKTIDPAFSRRRGLRKRIRRSFSNKIDDLKSSESE